jgi:LmbE family N-acetylglucosaminyl deacetylase
MKRLFRSLSLISWILIIPFIRIVMAQQPATTPPPDDRFKADILVVVAHPDDESIIAGYLAKASLDEHKRIAVVFTTRGDAGQNLVGYEQAASLAEIREMEARQALASIGVTNVWFLRGPDTPWQDVPDVLRSLERWNHGNILGELVRFVRLTRPEVIITMLPDVVVGENHEDHQAAGVVATEAFDLAGDPTWFPEQVGVPEDHLWYANLMEGLHTWQPEKLYYFTDASHFDFVEGKGPEYPMTEVSPSRHVSYARLAAEEISFHKTQYDGQTEKELQSGDLRYYKRPLMFILGKSLVGGTITGDIFQNVVPGPIPFAKVRGYEPPKAPPDFSVELGGGWAFYKVFYPAHDLDSMPELLAPELGVGPGQDFSIPLLLYNNTDNAETFSLQTKLPAGWSLDSNSAQYAHHYLPEKSFTVPAHDYFPVRIRLVAPQASEPEWQEITWMADVDGKPTAPITLKIHIGRD